ncbi:DUF488 domain-containing protein [Rhodothermus marinus]|uniref:DUF488 domain-containing protein n=1 Tax=Rhodothermus marinus TaxID=29549 RepID=UPI0012BA4117|nr:DUF488 domain-containing protein [Rhodothermus marinus]BBM69632.1 hypothetical protein RmaAA213_14780 [Rhodothermus marinus]BBM72614.1 hypothetical protein RmaAA338_14790 [Rhodothermus marinus]
MNEVQPLFTVGYGTSSIEEFINVLKQYEIKCIVDIRSNPYSKFNPDFSIGTLKNHLEKNGIAYEYMGDTLGGKPTDESCLENDKPIFSVIKEKDFFKEGIRKLLSLWRYYQPQRIALMCACQYPDKCHRSKLVGQYIYETRSDNDIRIIHIYKDKNGEYKVIEQDKVILKIVSGQLNLFGFDFESKIAVSGKKIKKDA